MLVTKQIEIDMGHRVPNHKSKCSSPHGHRYKIEAGVDDKLIVEKGSSDEGMVIDFGDLKHDMMNVIDGCFDHGFMISSEDEFMNMAFFGAEYKNWAIDGSRFASIGYDKPRVKGYSSANVIVVPFVPTVENISKLWFKLLDFDLKKKGINLQYLKVWETPTSTATYENESC